MIKIGILTYQRAHNHGALLQAFALQYLLSKNGLKSELIDYRIIGTPEFYKIQKKNLVNFYSISFWHDIVKGIYFYRTKRKKNKVFSDFQNKHLTYSIKKYPTKEELTNSKIEDEYRYFIAGSDQIWNFDISLSDYAYFLDFISNRNKKIAYAGSFGKSKLDSSILRNLQNYLNSFSSLSVRELNAAKIIREATNLIVPVVLDPTFLLSKIEWKKLMKSPDTETPYILCFVIGYCSKQTIGLCEKLQKDNDLPILMIGSSGLLERFNKKIKFIDVLSPFELIGYIDKAKFVVTSSFHGTAFSIIMKKQFYALPTNLKDKNSERNSRITNLLDMLKISERYIYDFEKFDSCAQININYFDVDKVLSEKRKDSINFLLESLKITNYES